MINLDTEHSDLKLAQTLVQDKANNLIKISKKTGIGEPTLRSYRNDPSKLETASWKNVRALAVLQVNAIIQEEVGLHAVLDIQSRVTSWFDEELHAFDDDEQTTAMIQSMKETITNNPMALAKIAVAFNK